MVTYSDQLTPFHGNPDILSRERLAGKDKVIDITAFGGSFTLR
jgi:hypothetical protein